VSRIVRAGGHPRAHLATYAGLFQADAYGGYVIVYEPVQPRPVVEAMC
jgi:transposase